jgi:hypothetical protein
MTGYERTGWRDEQISNRHREWGFNCPSVDLDFVMVEYNHGAPVAVVEYKHHKSSLPVSREHPSMRALGQLYGADGKQLPLLVAYYWPDMWAFRFRAYNERAVSIFETGNWIDCSERQWVGVLYGLRSQYLHEAVLSKLMTGLPPNQEVA